MSRRAKSCPVHSLGVQGSDGHPGACGTCSSHSPSPATDAFPKPLTVLLSITQHVPSSLILQSMHSSPKRPLKESLCLHVWGVRGLSRVRRWPQRRGAWGP